MYDSIRIGLFVLCKQSYLYNYLSCLFFCCWRRFRVFKGAESIERELLRLLIIDKLQFMNDNINCNHNVLLYCTTLGTILKFKPFYKITETYDWLLNTLRGKTVWMYYL